MNNLRSCYVECTLLLDSRRIRLMKYNRYEDAILWKIYKKLTEIVKFYYNLALDTKMDKRIIHTRCVESMENYVRKLKEYNENVAGDGNANENICKIIEIGIENATEITLVFKRKTRTLPERISAGFRKFLCI